MRLAQQARKAIAGLGGIVGICALGMAVLGQNPAAKEHSRGVSTAADRRSGGSGYVGSDACSSCHGRIYREYKKTAMGHSIVSADPDAISRLTVPAHFTNGTTNRHFDIFAQDGKLYESEYAIGTDGKEIFRDTRGIQWLIGAGVNGYGPVVEQDHYLFQAPLSYYTKPQSWGPSPGYESLDLGFNRPILTE